MKDEGGSLLGADAGVRRHQVNGGLVCSPGLAGPGGAIRIV